MLDRVAIAATLLIFLFIARPADARIYRYVDRAGNVHFTTKLDEVPKAQRAKLIKARETATPLPDGIDPAQARIEVTPSRPRRPVEPVEVEMPTGEPRPVPGARANPVSPVWRLEGEPPGLDREQWNERFRLSERRIADARSAVTDAEKKVKIARLVAIKVSSREAFADQAEAIDQLAAARAELEDAERADSALRRDAIGRGVPRSWLD